MPARLAAAATLWRAIVSQAAVRGVRDGFLLHRRVHDHALDLFGLDASRGGTGTMVYYFHHSTAVFSMMRHFCLPSVCIYAEQRHHRNAPKARSHCSAIGNEI